jgi:hypothetical protein
MGRMTRVDVELAFKQYAKQSRAVEKLLGLPEQEPPRLHLGSGSERSCRVVHGSVSISLGSSKKEAHNLLWAMTEALYRIEERANRAASPPQDPFGNA